MKTFVRIIAIALIAVFSLALLTSCGKSMDKIVDKIKDLDEDDYEYEKITDEVDEMMDYFEEEFDLDLDGDVEKAYSIVDKDFNGAYVIEFEKAADAKAYAETVEDELEDILEDLSGGQLDDRDYVVMRSGKIVAWGHEDIIEEIW